MRINRGIRLFILRNMSDNKVSTDSVAEKVAAMSPQELIRNVVKVSNWNKMLLVFSGRFKSMKDVPDTLPFATVDKERNKVRIKVANYMMVMTVVGCIFTVISGKRAAEAGDSVSKRQLDWHKEYNEQARKAEAAAAAAGASKTA